MMKFLRFEMGSHVLTTIRQWTVKSVVTLGLVATTGVVHAAPVSLGIPTYFDPSDNVDWNLVKSGASKVSIVIFNPWNGPDPAQAAAYKSLYSSLHSLGVTVLGYVHTASGCRPYMRNYPGGDPAGAGKGVEGDIQEWSKEGNVDGIFLDEGPGPGTWGSPISSFFDGVVTYQPGAAPECSGTNGSYYQPIRAFTQSQVWPGKVPPVIVLNPGGPTDEQYLYDAGGANTQKGVADIIMNVEEGASGGVSGYNNYANNAWLTAQFAPGGGMQWVYNHSPNHFWQIATDYDCLASEVDNSVAIAQNRNASYIFFTDKYYSTMPCATIWNREVAASVGHIAPPAGNGAPSAPTGLAATAGAGQVSLTWTASSGATSYNVYRGTTAGGESATPIATGLTGTSYMNTGLTNGATYYYKVAAVNAGGTSPLSNEASATPTAATATIYNVQESASGGNITFSFSYTGSWTYFHVYIDKDLNAATGYTISGIGADYLIENSGLYKSTANGSGWNWAYAADATYSNSGSAATFTLPSSLIGSPAHFNAVYQVVAADGTTSYTTSAFSY